MGLNILVVPVEDDGAEHIRRLLSLLRIWQSVRRSVLWP